MYYRGFTKAKECKDDYVFDPQSLKCVKRCSSEFALTSAHCLAKCPGEYQEIEGFPYACEKPATLDWLQHKKYDADCPEGF